MMTLVGLIDCAKKHSLSYNIITPKSSTVTVPPFNSTKENPSILFLLNFTTSQRSALLSASSTLALLYTPENEHFGIGPIEAMVCGLPVLACNSGGPTESVVDPSSSSFPPSEEKEDAEEDELRTGWLREPDSEVWANALLDIVTLGADERKALGERARRRAQQYFGMEAMASGLEKALKDAVAMGEVNTAAGVYFVMAVIMVLLALFLRISTVPV